MATYIRLTDYKSSDEKEQEFFNPENRYEAKQKDFSNIPGNPIGYWVSNRVNKIFSSSIKLGNISELKGGMSTSDNERFLRYWNEVSLNKIGFKLTGSEETYNSNNKWFPYNKGGSFRKWYGNLDYIINYKNNGKEIKNWVVNNPKDPKTTHWSRRLFNTEYFFKKGITWSEVSTCKFANRLIGEGFIFDSTGQMCFIEESQIKYMSSLLNTKIIDSFLEMINPTQHFTSGTLSKLPIIFPELDKVKQKIEILTQENIDISKQEWDSRETSWDFIKNELLIYKQDGSLENALTVYSTHWTKQFKTLHQNEEELNHLFIDIYGLADELTSDVALEDITILKNEAKIVNNKLVFDNKEVIKQFISYSVGCMFGRYTLDEEGLVVANQNQEIQTDTTYEIDDDNIIPIVDESDYFSDDMTDRFTEFVRTTFGSEKLQQNIAFIEASIGKKLRVYFQKDFYVDHTKRYKKRPIYWLFTSPKGTFKTLIYMHRYTPDTLNHILNDYLRPFRIRLESMRDESMRTTESESSSSREKTEADKKIDKIDKTLDDINEYEKTLAHYAAMRIEIDLDDGVKVNYCKFKELLFEYDKKLCK